MSEDYVADFEATIAAACIEALLRLIPEDKHEEAEVLMKTFSRASFEAGIKVLSEEIEKEGTISE